MAIGPPRRALSLWAANGTEYGVAASAEVTEVTRDPESHHW